jgi:hypothetical protein
MLVTFQTKTDYHDPQKLDVLACSDSIGDFLELVFPPAYNGIPSHRVRCEVLSRYQGINMTILPSPRVKMYGRGNIGLVQVVALSRDP